MTKGHEKAGVGEQVGYARGVDPGSSVWYMGNLFSILAGSEDTGGRFGLMETLAAKGTEPPRHIHHREDESFYVFEGEVTFYVGDETKEAGPGTFVFAPRGVPHSFVFGTDVIRMLTIVTPGGIEEHFRDPKFSEPAWSLTLPPPSEVTPDLAAFAENLAGYGVEIIGPPGPPEQE